MGYAEKRGTGKTTYYRARYKAPDGTYPAVKDAAGHTVRFRTKREAEDAARDAEAEIRAGRWIAPDRSATTVAQWYERWRPAQHYDRLNTQEAYDRAWRKHIAPRWGTLALGEVMPIDVQGWETKLRAVHARSTVTIIMTVLRQLLESAHANQMIPHSPLPPRPRRTRNNTAVSPGVVVPIATWEEICARLEPADALLARIIYWTGMRWSEASAMRTRFLTLTPATPDVPASGSYHLHPEIGAAHELPSGERYYGAPKSGPGRDFDLPPFVAEQLIERVALMPAQPLSKLPEDRDVIFPDRHGRPHRETSWTSVRWRPACDGRAQTQRKDAWAPVWPKLRPHDGKHSHGAMMDDLGTHPVMRDYRMGHKIPGARGVYSHPTPEMREQLMLGLQARWEAYRASVVPAFSPDSPRDLFEYAGIQVTRP